MVYDYKRDELNLKVTEVTLLSEEEVEACGEYIRHYDVFAPWYMYLRTPHEDNLIGLAAMSEDCAEVDDPTDPDYEDCWEPYDEDDCDGCGEIKVVFGTGIRPMLRLESEKVSDKITLVPGDCINIGNESFTYISNNILLRDYYLHEKESYGIFDKKTNIYEKSEAKRRVDAWFNKQIKPCLD